MFIPPRKSLGQNFMVNPHILDKIVSAADINKNDIILEVGPGTGNLTKKLAEKAKKVIAIEKDHRLIEPLREHLSKEHENIEIVEGDILKMLPAHWSLLSDPYKIVANIPYYITSHFLRKIFEEFPQPTLIVLTIQKEVARRIMAKPPDTNLLALSVQYYAEPEIVGIISKNNFRPIPKIDSAIIRLKPKSNEHRDKEQEDKLFELIRIGFSEKRKKLAGLLSKKHGLTKEGIAEAFQKAGVDINARAQNLSLEQWGKISEALFI